MLYHSACVAWKKTFTGNACKPVCVTWVSKEIYRIVFFLSMEADDEKAAKLNFIITFCCCCRSPILDKTISCFPCFTGLFFINIWLLCLLSSAEWNFKQFFLHFSFECNARAGIVDKTSSLFVWPRGMPWQKALQLQQSNVIVNSALVEFFSSKIQNITRVSKEKGQTEANGRLNVIYK